MKEPYFSLTFKSVYFLIQTALVDGGATINLEQTDHDHASWQFVHYPDIRFVVGGLVESVVLPVARAFDGSATVRDGILRFVEEHGALLAQKNTFLGLWVENEEIHLDVVDSYRLQNVAERAGCARGESAIFDAREERSIYLVCGKERV